MSLGVNFFGIILLSLYSVFSYSQSASAIFISEHNEPFQITINHVKQHLNYTNNAIVSKLTGNLPYNVKINFENDTTFVQKNIYLIDNGLAHIYHITKESIQLKKVIPSVSSIKTENQLVITYLESIIQPFKPILKDSIATKDTAYIIPFTSYYKLENYNGKISCPFPIKDIEQAELRGIILAETLEESKLEKIKIAIQEIDSACVLVDQIKELIVLLEFEETKLDFAKFMYPYAFDIDNYEKLYSTFNYENSKDELEEFIGKEE